LLAAKDFWSEPANLVNLWHIDDWSVNLTFIVGMVFVFLDLFSQIHYHHAIGGFIG
jgi:hypothetical protein